MVNIYVLSMEENTFLVEHIKRQIEKQRVGDRIMTKFSDEFIAKVKTQKYTLDDVADHFGITESQARRILYVKPTKPKEHISEVQTYQR